MRDDGARRRGGRPHAFDDGCIIRAGRDHVQALHRQLLDASRRSQRLDLEAQVTVDLFFRGSFELHALESVPVAEQLEVLPRGEEKHRDEEEAEPHRAPHVALPIAIDLAHDWIVPYVFPDRVFECFGRHTDPWRSACQDTCSAARSFELRARGLRAISASVGTTGRLVRIFRPPSACSARNVCFTIRSSSEWNVMTDSRPPADRFRAADARNVSSPSSSRLTQMRMAWNVRVAGSILE